MLTRTSNVNLESAKLYVADLVKTCSGLLGADPKHVENLTALLGLLKKTQEALGLLEVENAWCKIRLDRRCLGCGHFAGPEYAAGVEARDVIGHCERISEARVFPADEGRYGAVEVDGAFCCAEWRPPSHQTTGSSTSRAHSPGSGSGVTG